MSSIRYPESLSNTNRGDRWCLKTRGMYRMKNEGNYTFVFSQISKLKNWEKSLVLSIIINKYNTHSSTFNFHLTTCPREPPPFPPNFPSPTIESIRVYCYKKIISATLSILRGIRRNHSNAHASVAYDLFFFIRTRPIDSPFHPRMPTNRGIHGRVVGRIIRAMISRLERVCLTPLISRQGSYRCQDLGGGVRSDRGALSSLFAPHSSLV